MTLQRLSRLAIAVIALSFMQTGGAGAQNAMAANTRTDTVYDGVTFEQLKSFFSDTVINGSAMTLTEQVEPGRIPYFSLTSPQLPFVIYVSGVEEAYSGEGDGVYAGFALFTTLRIDSLTQNDVNTFNYQAKFAKYIPSQTSGILSVELLAAGGVTQKTAVTAVLPFFSGLSHLIDMASASANTVNYESGGYDIRGEVTWLDGAYAVQYADPPMLPSKISTSSISDMADDRLIRDFVETAANRR